ncbi:hypothetical protein [endosymbiont GvMRE of Glomus versiforme]|uniref:hypothetical protein n=1 Tax=endosymbiont GvMRE of Glomus versiforme TaxID=2039283 RepID=UPI000ED79231|nr:hypothetical protein [endosymbiont GvMRE of Glomus versiforme]RHZ35533.1 hypothetical protein GvMRE_IIg279 [endosymbiont GvMRE of Glomus versiforme]
MRSIIYWLTLMIILPLFYLFRWNEKRRLLLGIAIGVFSILGFLICPDEVAYSIVHREIKKSFENRNIQLKRIEKKFEQLLAKPHKKRNIFRNKEKETLENDLKEIVKNIKRDPILLLGNEGKLWGEKFQEWKHKWSNEKPLLTLFYGKELASKITEEHDFGNKGCKIDSNFVKIDKKSSPGAIKRKIVNIIKSSDYKKDPILFFKDIDKLNENPRLKEIILSFFNSQQNNSWKYEKELLVDEKNNDKTIITITPDLNRFVLIASVSEYNYKLPKEIQKELRVRFIKSIFDEYSFTIFLVSCIVEFLVFLFLTKTKKSSIV